MKDDVVKLELQDAAKEIARRFPDRAFSLFVCPAEQGQRAQYVANAPREQAIVAMSELIRAGLPGIPGRDLSRS